MSGMWMVEEDYGINEETGEQCRVWNVVDEDGNLIRPFRHREDAEEWLEFQQEAAEVAAEAADWVQ